MQHLLLHRSFLDIENFKKKVENSFLNLFLLEQRRAKSKEQRTKNKEQRAKNTEQRAKSKEQRTKSKEKDKDNENNDSAI